MGNRELKPNIVSRSFFQNAIPPTFRIMEAVVCDTPTSQPTRPPRRPDEHWLTGFTGFLTGEGLFCNLRHTEKNRVSEVGPGFKIEIHYVEITRLT